MCTAALSNEAVQTLRVRTPLPILGKAAPADSEEMQTSLASAYTHGLQVVAGPPRFPWTHPQTKKKKKERKEKMDEIATCTMKKKQTQ